jgi:hypothetical protein
MPELYHFESFWPGEMGFAVSAEGSYDLWLLGDAGQFV